MNRVRIAVVFTPYVLVGIVHLVALVTDAAQLSTFTTPLLMPLLLAGLLLAHVAYLGLFLRKLRMRRLPAWAAIYGVWQVDFLVMLSYIAAQGLIALGLVYWAKGRVVSSPIRATSPEVA